MKQSGRESAGVVPALEQPDGTISGRRDGGGLKGAPRPSPLVREISRLMLTVLVTLVTAALLQRYVFNLSVVEGRSMQPSLYGGDWLVVNKLAMTLSAPHHGDIVILRDPEPYEDPPGYLVKRVIGLPGDRVELRKGYLYLNGERLSEPYINFDQTAGEFLPVAVGSKELFVMGDNRGIRASRDSRAFGLVSYNAVQGKAEWILWPTVRMHKL